MQSEMKGDFSVKKNCKGRLSDSEEEEKDEEPPFTQDVLDISISMKFKMPTFKLIMGLWTRSSSLNS